LKSKLEDYNSSDNKLSDTETDNIEAQLDYHMELKELHQAFQIKSKKMRNEIRNKLKVSFSQLQEGVISETHINEIEDILEQEFYEIQKKQVDDNLNVTS
jgi:hypothetical protein